MRVLPALGPLRGPCSHLLTSSPFFLFYREDYASVFPRLGEESENGRMGTERQNTKDIEEQRKGLLLKVQTKTDVVCVCISVCVLGGREMGSAIGGSRGIPEKERNGQERRGVSEVMYWIAFHVPEGTWVKNVVPFSSHWLLDCGSFYSKAPRNQPHGPWDLLVLYE